MMLATSLPSYRSRDGIRLSVTAALAGGLPPEPQALLLHRRNWETNGGAQVMPPRADPPGVDPRRLELERSGYRPTAWTCHPVNALYAERFLNFAAAHGVPVFWLLPPYHPEVDARRQRYGWYEQYAAYLRGLQQRHPNLTVVDSRGSGYPAEVLADMTHLSRPGAVAYSDALGRLLADRLATPRPAPRWVALPRFDPIAAEPVVAAGVEDFTQSARALERLAAEAKVRRAARRSVPEGDRRRR
jgi:hypothetical protein